MGRANGIRVMLVEDNTDFRQSMKSILHAKFPSLQFEEAGSADEALRKVDPAGPDLFFVDIHLPGKNGLELTRQINELYPKAIIVVLTSYDLPEYRERAYRNGASLFFSKDSPVGYFFAVVESITSKCQRS